MPFPSNPELDDVQGIIVLRGAEETKTAAAWEQPAVGAAADRLIAGIHLARRFPGALVLLAGGGDGGAREADIAETVFVDAGIAPERLIVEGRSRNTAGNARLSKTIADPSGPGN